MKKNNTSRYSIGILIGIISAIAIGILYNEIGLGIATGLPLGISIGFLLTMREDA